MFQAGNSPAGPGMAHRPEGRAVSGRGSQATFSAGQRGEGQPQLGSGGGEGL